MAPIQYHSHRLQPEYREKIKYYEMTSVIIISFWNLFHFFSTSYLIGTMERRGELQSLQQSFFAVIVEAA